MKQLSETKLDLLRRLKEDGTILTREIIKDTLSLKSDYAVEKYYEAMEGPPDTLEDVLPETPTNPDLQFYQLYLRNGKGVEVPLRVRFQKNMIAVLEVES